MLPFLDSAPPEERFLLAWVLHDLIDSISLRDPDFVVGDPEFDLLAPYEAVERCRSLLEQCNGAASSRPDDSGPTLRAAAIHLGRLIELEIAEQFELDPPTALVTGRYLLQQAAIALEWPAPRQADVRHPQDWAGCQYLFVRRWTRACQPIADALAGRRPADRMPQPPCD